MADPFGWPGFSKTDFLFVTLCMEQINYFCLSKDSGRIWVALPPCAFGDAIRPEKYIGRRCESGRRAFPPFSREMEPLGSAQGNFVRSGYLASTFKFLLFVFHSNIEHAVSMQTARRQDGPEHFPFLSSSILHDSILPVGSTGRNLEQRGDGPGKPASCFQI
ncbi:hypothetical protein CONLIGDRAFT_455739 [Coniochaeta ligniaria NRRL 30616]|uniref:Uncharacterized protein n=1 Tax=Coniochaeta ligniaria NRRL 30616 TaxID=1408157 RepID=A0A1J7JJW1_9PEZI|nr:hypothetical protein CONLIGDRAFT_455739 [Coniochaeta ligniaria NRRL 30616]